MAYSSITISGSMMAPTFAVYLFVIKTSSDTYYYVGMTGDNYYPSARSGIHRLAGHFDKSQNSTQNQVQSIINDKEFNMDELKVTMYHWPIDGFESWGTLKGFKRENLSEEESKKYKNYLKKREQVYHLEQYLIESLFTRDMKKGALQNKGRISEKHKKRPEGFDSIISEFEEIIASNQ